MSLELSHGHLCLSLEIHDERQPIVTVRAAGVEAEVLDLARPWRGSDSHGPSMTYTRSGPQVTSNDMTVIEEHVSTSGTKPTALYWSSNYV